MEYKKKWIKEGMNVAERDNLSKRMTVERILRKAYKYIDEHGNEQIRKRIEGVLCYWWETNSKDKNGTIARGTFHTNNLVPWDIAEEGYMAMMKFYEELENLERP